MEVSERAHFVRLRIGVRVHRSKISNAAECLPGPAAFSFVVRTARPGVEERVEREWKVSLG
jgi:hypothetical protein